MTPHVGVSECFADLTDVLEARIGRSARDSDVPATRSSGDIHFTAKSIGVQRRSVSDVGQSGRRHGPGALRP